MSKNGIELICFDAGGVLVRICRTWEEGCRAAGVPHRPRPDDVADRHARRALHEGYQGGRISADDFFHGIAAATAGAYTPDEVRRVHDAWIIDEYAGVRELVADIHRRAHLRTGVLSNTNERHWHLMGPLRSMVVFAVHHAHASHLLGHVKPDEGVYRAFEHATGYLPSQILLFDDLEENIAGAASAGWHAHLIDHAGDTAAQMRSHLEGLGLLD